MNKQRVVSNLAIMSLGQIVTWGLSFGTTALTSRYLGPSRLGEWTIAMSIVAMLGLVVSLGMNSYLTREIARAPERAGVLTSAAMLTRGLLALPLFGVLWVYVHLTHLNTETQIASYIIFAGMVIWALGGVMLSTFQGHENMTFGTVWAIAHNALYFILVGLVVWRHGTLLNFTLNDVIIGFLLLAMNLYFIRRYARLTRRVSRRDIREVVVGSLGFWATTIFGTIYGNIDAIILGTVAGVGPAGLYGAATRLFAVPLFLPGMIATATLPLLSRLGVDAGSDFARVGRKTITLLIVCAVPLTIGLATFAEPLIALINGPRFLSAVPVLIVLSLCILPTFLNVQFYQMLAAQDKQWRWTIVMAISCVLNPLANFILIAFAQRHWHNPAVGAALALLVTEAGMAIYGTISMRAVLLDRALGRIAVSVLVAGTAQLAIIWLTSGLWAPIGETLGVAAYAIIGIVTGAIPRDDVAMLSQIVIGRPRRFAR